MKNSFFKRITLAGLAVAMILGIAAAPVNAASQNLAPAAKISFTFDDGLTSAYTNVAPILKKYGLVGTDYVITKCAGMTATPNTCHANTDASYMTWTQIKALQSTYGWEIGSHTQTHPYLATKDATDGQPNVLTQAQVTQEISGSKADLAAQGINATAFSTPYGDYNMSTLATIAKYYSSHRGFADNNPENWPYNDYLLNTQQVQEPDTVASVEAKIDTAIANKQWLILTMHDVLPNPSKSTDDYQYATTKLDQIAAYVKTKVAAGQVANVNVSNGLVQGTNLMPNSTFNSGITGGWTTDNASAVKLDSGTNGSFPDATNSIKFTSSTTAAHLESPKVTVSSNSKYIFKSFLNVQAMTKGEVGFYVDEYDANGNWISGQWKTAEPSVFVENINIPYTPSSVNVSSASLQVYATANSGVTAYLDNVQLINASTTTPTNLLTNGGFTSGLTGWTTDDSTNIVADKLNHGGPSTPTDSVSLTANATKNTHLFSSATAVTTGKTYNFQSYLNITARTSGEVGYYIDEYDASGNWVSGQYKTGVTTVGTHEVGFTYTPSSATAKKAAIQVIMVGGSGIKAYLDDVSLSLQ